MKWPAFPGVVTKFHLNLLPYPKSGFCSSGYIYPRSLYREAFSWVLKVTPNLDEDTELSSIQLQQRQQQGLRFHLSCHYEGYTGRGQGITMTNPCNTATRDTERMVLRARQSVDPI